MKIKINSLEDATGLIPDEERGKVVSFTKESSGDEIEIENFIDGWIDGDLFYPQKKYAPIARFQLPHGILTLVFLNNSWVDEVEIHNE